MSLEKEENRGKVHRTMVANDKTVMLGTTTIFFFTGFVCAYVLIFFLFDSGHTA